MKSYIMNKKSFYILLILIVSVFNVNAQSAGKQPVFVLVHGAFHGGWCWQRVSKELRAKGDLVYTPTLTGLAEHKNTLNDKIDLNTHIDDIVNFIIAEDLHNVILVGHSYAGAVSVTHGDDLVAYLDTAAFDTVDLVEGYDV